MASRPGKIPTTLVCAADLLVQPLLRIVAPDLPPHLAGERGEGQDVLAGVIEMGAAAGNLASSAATTWACWARTEAGSGCSKMVRTRAGTHGWADFGTRVSRLRW